MDMILMLVKTYSKTEDAKSAFPRAGEVGGYDIIANQNIVKDRRCQVRSYTYHIIAFCRCLVGLQVGIDRI